jgi:hypothetical protein
VEPTLLHGDWRRRPMPIDALLQLLFLFLLMLGLGVTVRLSRFRAHFRNRRVSG